MHRFRKKSETRRSAAIPIISPSSEGTPPPLPALPPASDFRTSLILPSLSRRFTLLRNSSGEPLSAEQVRSRLAEQRIRGAANQISEEEEDMMIEALERMRSASDNNATSQEWPHTDSAQYITYNGDGPSYHDSEDQRSPSVYPESTYSDSPNMTPTKDKRRSNNLFGSGSGRMRDQSYIRTARASTSNHSLSSASVATPPRGKAFRETPENRPVTPENNSWTQGSITSSSQSSPLEYPAISPTSDTFLAGSSPPERREGRAVATARFRRASLALAQALRDLELEGGVDPDIGPIPISELEAELEDGDTILTPLPASKAVDQKRQRRNGTDSKPVPQDRRPALNSPSSPWRSQERFADMSQFSPSVRDAWEGSTARSPSPSRMGSASPVPGSDARVPGYVPGMHRPITPRDQEEDVHIHSNSTTPRATSPISPYRRNETQRSVTTNSPTNSNITRRGSNASSRPRPLPLDGNDQRNQSNASPSSSRSPPQAEESTRGVKNGSRSPDVTLPPHLTSSLMHRRRPSSPLATLTFQSEPNLRSNQSQLSRPVTPAASSTSVFGLPVVEGSSSDTSERDSIPIPTNHMRSDSVTSGVETTMENHHGGHSRNKTPRSLASPALPDSPLVPSVHQSLARNINGFSGDWDLDPFGRNAPASGTGAASPTTSTLRSPTPTASRSPATNLTSTNPRPTTPTSRSNTPAKAPLPVLSSTPRHQYHSRSSSSNGFYQYDTLASPANGHSGNNSGPSQAPTSPPRGQLPPSPTTYQPPMVLSPLLNSSRSSLISVGSSYHTWDEHKSGSLRRMYDNDDSWEQDSDPTLVDSDVHERTLEKKLGVGLADMTAMQSKLVHAALASAAEAPDVVSIRSTPSRRRRSSASRPPPVAAAADIIMYRSPPMAKPKTPPPAAPSPVSSPISPTTSRPLPTPPPPPPHSTTPPTSPPPQPYFTSEMRSSSPSSDKASKENALLRSVMDSIASPPSTPPPPPPPQGSSTRSPSTRPPSTGPPLTGLSPQTSFGSGSSASSEQRRRDLADALFGAAIKVQDEPVIEVPVLVQEPGPEPEPEPEIATSNLAHPDLTIADLDVSQSSSSTPSPPLVPSAAASGSTALDNRPSSQNADTLREDVGRKAAAATAALKSPSTVALHDDHPAPRKTTKKIKPSKISNPQFVSSTTSVNTIPINSPSMSSLGTTPPNSQHGSAKFSFKKLRGSLRMKPVATGDEVNPWSDRTSPPALYSPPSSAQSARYPPSMGGSTTHLNAASSSTPSALLSPAFKFPASPTLASPPASAGPRAGIKGFMARMRSKPKKTGDSVPETAGYKPSTTPHSPNLSAHPDWGMRDRPAPSPLGKNVPQSPPTLLPSAVITDNRIPRSAPPDTNAQFDTSSSHDEGALRQLFDAASNLGLDQGALSELLVRSKSTTSRSTGWASPPPRNVVSPALTMDRRPLSPDSFLQRSASARVPARQASVRTPVSRPMTAIKDDESEQGPNVIVRRTLYIPNDSKIATTGDLQAMVGRKSSMKHRRTRSTSSAHSGKSLVDRAPTPPPPRGPRRLSTEASPPLPLLPPSLSRDSKSPMTPARSQYSSLYDMYETEPSTGFITPDPTMEASTSSAVQLASSTSRNDSANAAGPALQLVEYSNGQVVWSVVDSLRSAGAGADSEYDYDGVGDDSSLFDRNRASTMSTETDGANRGDARDDAVQLLFREHRRISSKGSGTSFVSRRKVLPPSKSDFRPETKVFFSSAADIENLIESISRGLEAGSFNILPNRQDSAHTSMEPVPSLPPLHLQRRTTSPTNPRRITDDRDRI